ncbi:MAG TPA: penicillin-binding transpeptidase domain-containing protein, partial [Acidimicrobiales bacterium]|nr:penicillin-binding transpeptidase domain-containing protein [Acidimicrobiales bacterium]
RIWRLAIVVMFLFALVVGQAAYVQFFHAKALDASTLNPRNDVSTQQYPRGEILAADGEVLAQSIPTASTTHPWRRIYPQGSLFSAEVGFTSTVYGNWALEAQYNSYLQSHALPPQSFEQLLEPTTGDDSITLTLQPELQKVARAALGGKDGSVVAIVPSTGAILAMYSNPTYNPLPFTAVSTATQEAAWTRDNKKDAEGYPPLGLVATQQTIFPGSTFKVITTAGIVKYNPSLLTKEIPDEVCTALPDSNKTLCNDGLVACGGTVEEMLPQSCDPGYALLGIDLGAQDLTATANAFGYNQVPPIDLPGAVASFFPTESNLAANPPFLAYSAIGQEDVESTALQNALVAAGIADGGTIMTPHLLASVQGPDGATIMRYRDSAWKTPLTKSQAAQITPLMEKVVTEGTAYGIFLPQDDVAAKTGTAQVGNALTNDTDDWMIAFAPATNPVIAVAVSVPFQNYSATGAVVAGPIMKCVIEAAIAMSQGQPATGTSTTCDLPSLDTTTTSTTTTTLPSN